MSVHRKARAAARSFSEVLNRVAAGEEVEVVGNGAAVAVIVPARGMLVSAEMFRELIASAPSADEDFRRRRPRAAGDGRGAR